jgi:NLI interacting factor-like phosphatase
LVKSSEEQVFLWDRGRWRAHIRETLKPGRATHDDDQRMIRWSTARLMGQLGLGMAYYPGNYYQTRLLHVGDYYTHGLFGTIAVHRPDDDIDPYADWHPKPHSPSSFHRPSNDLPLSSKHLRDREKPPLTNPCARPRTPRPSPPPSPGPSSPYLEFASTSSKTLSAPTRKLLVLDLNGSLLLRSPRPPKSYRGHHQHRQHPAPRRVMRRPYLTTLRAYLFASQTRAWLDVMVWSSAQPHSVEDMVLHAFGKDRTWLVAIWARDTLGLEEGHYRASFPLSLE